MSRRKPTGELVRYDAACRAVWGNEIERAQLGQDEAPYDGDADFAGSINDCYAAVRERVAAGGEGWTPK